MRRLTSAAPARPNGRAGAARDFVLFVLGLVLLGYETLAPPEPRWILITVAVAMMGLPGALVADRWLVDRTTPPAPEPPAGPAPSESGPVT